MTTIADYRKKFPGIAVNKICEQLKGILGDSFDYSIDENATRVTLKNVPKQNEQEIVDLIATVGFKCEFY
jgi:hypothetical protein